MKKKIILSSIIIICLLAAGLFYFRYQVYYSHGNYKNEKTFEIKKGEGNGEIAAKLAEEGLISGKIYFHYYSKYQGIVNKILPGIYKLSGNMSIPEIAHTITNLQDLRIKVTFPEGWNSKKMAARLNENGLPGDEFLKRINDADAFRPKYDFLADAKISNLEGFLFPDTYYFPPDSDGEKIIKLMLNDFGLKVDADLREDIQKQNRTLKEIITMASIIEMEVKSEEDRKVVSGIFWNRIEKGMPLQSCATLAFVLGENKKQYTYEDTQIKSLFNTYQNAGLPPGPIGNPGLASIEAAANPKDTGYFYFLSDPETGKTVFSKTIDEHNANKDRYGL
ncbi:MAG TPA: endolytic transglycosylase MltG [Candidatus Moranbacteria bacterium]|nr:endolytic transglycosylase MltG [Candidatus Moranbacteria bacterium]